MQFMMTTNACRGFCESFAVPAAPVTDSIGGIAVTRRRTLSDRPVRSMGQCCNIMRTEDVHKLVHCLDGVRNVTFKSATECKCYHCRSE